MTISIRRSDGIQLCLVCPHPDCIGEENCKPLLEFVENEPSSTRKKTKTETREEKGDVSLGDILSVLQREEKGYLLTTEIMKQVKIKHNLLFSLIRQGKIKTVKSDINLTPNVKGRPNRVMVVGVEFFNG